MSEFVECDSCTAKLSVDAPTLYKIENVGRVQTFGSMMEAHACSPECVEEIGRRISRQQHGLNPVVGRPELEWSSSLDGPETEERHQVTIWGDLRSGGVVPPDTQAAWEMEKMLKQSQGYSSPIDPRQGWKEPRRRRGDVSPDPSLPGAPSPKRWIARLRRRNAD